MDEKQQVEFRKLAAPLVEWLNSNYHPHVTVLITPTSAELLEGIMAAPITEFVKD